MKRGKERKGKEETGKGKETGGRKKKGREERKEQSNFKIPYNTHLYIFIFQPRLQWRRLIVVLS